MNVAAMVASATLASHAAIAAASAQECEKYQSLRSLPDGFVQIAAAELVKGEFFVLTDGVCTCDNLPAVNRGVNKPAPQGVNWACRAADSDERAAVSERGN